MHTISAKRKTISAESIQFRKCLIGFCKRFPSSRLPSLGRLLSRLPCDSPWVFPDRSNFHVKQTCEPVSNQAPFSEFGRSITGQGRFRAAMPVWRLTDNTDSISRQRRKRKYQRPTEGERRAIIDAHLASDEKMRDCKSSEGRHGQSSPAINTPARSSAGREAAALHHRLDDREKGPAGDVSGGQSPVDAETSGPHLAAVRVPAARAAMSLR